MLYIVCCVWGVRCVVVVVHVCLLLVPLYLSIGFGGSLFVVVCWCCLAIIGHCVGVCVVGRVSCVACCDLFLSCMICCVVTIVGVCRCVLRVGH